MIIITFTYAKHIYSLTTSPLPFILPSSLIFCLSTLSLSSRTLLVICTPTKLALHYSRCYPHSRSTKLSFVIVINLIVLRVLNMVRD